MSEHVDWKAWKSRNKTKSKFAGKTGSKSGPPKWALRMKYLKAPADSELWLKIQKYKGEEFYEFYSTFLEVRDDEGKPRKRHVISNSHNGELDVPDLLDYYCREEENENMFAKQQFALAVVHLDDFHKAPRISRKGTRYTELVQCGGKDRYGRATCELCDAGVETVFGEQRHWSMWPSIQKKIAEQLAALPGRCSNCKTGEISVFGFECTKCEHVLGNQYNQPIPAADEDRFLHEEIECPECKHTGKLKQLVECARRVGEDDWEEGCDKPTRTDVGDGPFDVDKYEIRVKFEKVGNYTRPTITDFRPHDPETIRPEIRSAMEMNQFLGHMELDEQAKAMKRSNPFGAEAAKALADFFTAGNDEEDAQSKPWPKASE